jgi:two-component system OmpR family sensor kinase
MRHDGPFGYGHGHGFRDGHEHFRRHRRWRGAPLHRRLFWWFGFTILMMGAVTSTVVWLVTPAGGDDDWRRVQTFTSGRFRVVWNDAAARAELVTAVAKELEVGIALEDAKGRPLERAGPDCHDRDLTVLVKDATGAKLGEVHACLPRDRGRSHATFLFALFAAGATLWLASFAVARRIGRPLRNLEEVARDIGEGHLQRRVHLGWHQPGEVGALAESINDMAGRIEKQLSDQRELVAAVSHEIRAPLSRLRVLVELLRDRGADGATLAKLDREVVEIDSLVGDLLASSRLEFSMMAWRSLDATELVREALDRAGTPDVKIDVQADVATFEGDATLVARALANLLENAARHAGGVTGVSIKFAAANHLDIEIDDAGPGFAADVLPRAFEAFQKGQAERRGSTSLGLGLALVRRIAEAHGGTALAENRSGGGARVTLRLSRTKPLDPR